MLYYLIPAQFPYIWLIKLTRYCIGLEKKLPLCNFFIFNCHFKDPTRPFQLSY